MTDDGHVHRRRSIRLRGWDYTTAGAYFITVGTHDRICLLGEVLDGKMCLNDLGMVVADSWRWLASQYPYVVLDEWCVMPDTSPGVERWLRDTLSPLFTGPTGTFEWDGLLKVCQKIA